MAGVGRTPRSPHASNPSRIEPSQIEPSRIEPPADNTYWISIIIMSSSTLGSFLSQRFEPANTYHEGKSSSTSSPHYSFDDITRSGRWNFSPQWVRNEYTETLNKQRGNLPTSSTTQMSPQAKDLKVVSTESGFAEYAGRTIFQDLNRAFEAVSEHEYPRLRDRTSWPEDRRGLCKSN